MIDKNTRIKQTIKETRERHAGMRCRVYRVKILERKLSRKQREHLNLLFLKLSGNIIIFSLLVTKKQNVRLKLFQFFVVIALKIENFLI